MKREVIIGERFGRLKVLKETVVKKKRYVETLCDCGNKKEIYFYSLVNGKTKSCGCYNKEVRSSLRGLSNSRIYRIYYAMVQRCYNKKSTNYFRYGKKGIGVCKEWKESFLNFYNWSINNGYADNLSIDRIDNKKDYSPYNCRWATRETQSINQEISENNTSGYTGVYFCKITKKWVTAIGFKYKTKYIKSCLTKREAVEARNKYILENGLPHKIQEYKGV